MRRLILVALIFGGVGGAAQAREHSEIISTKGYDLSTRSGAEAFYQRLKHVAADVCRIPSYNLAPQGELLQHDECYEEALDTAVTKAGSPFLTAVHEGAHPTRLASSSR
jgi:UrcA family protein